MSSTFWKILLLNEYVSYSSSSPLKIGEERLGHVKGTVHGTCFKVYCSLEMPLSSFTIVVIVDLYLGQISPDSMKLQMQMTKAGIKFFDVRHLIQ